MCRLGLLATVALFSFPALAGEYAVLSNGFRIRADRHETQGNSIRLISGQSVTEMPASIVQSFEQFDDPTPTLVAPASAGGPFPTSSLEKPASAPVIVDPRVLIHDAAAQSGLPIALVESVARAESAFRSDAVSPKGALGIMQLMPDTARKLSVDPHDPVQNTQAGARLLRDLLIRYNGDVPKALAAYNAGEGAVDRYHGIPPYAETQNYVVKVIRDYIRAGGK